MPERVERTDPEGVDYGWVMQVTFVATIVVGVPVVALASLGATLPTWTDRAVFAVRVGAAVWIVTGLSVYAYARRRVDDEEEEEEIEAGGEEGDSEESEESGQSEDDEEATQSENGEKRDDDGHAAADT